MGPAMGPSSSAWFRRRRDAEQPMTDWQVWLLIIGVVIVAITVVGTVLRRQPGEDREVEARRRSGGGPWWHGPTSTRCPMLHRLWTPTGPERIER